MLSDWLNPFSPRAQAEGRGAQSAELNSMSLPTLTASLFNLAGPDFIIILVIFILMGVPLIPIVLLVMYLSHRKSAQPPPLPTAASVADRLQKLENLKQQKLVSDTEYEEQRRKIISGI